MELNQLCVQTAARVDEVGLSSRETSSLLYGFSFHDFSCTFKSAKCMILEMDISLTVDDNKLAALRKCSIFSELVEDVPVHTFSLAPLRRTFSIIEDLFTIAPLDASKVMLTLVK